MDSSSRQIAILLRAGLAAGLALFTVGCGSRLPEDPQARVAEVRQRIAAAPTTNLASSWLVHVAENPSEDARDLLLENMREPHLQMGPMAAYLTVYYWIEDPVVRTALAEYYLDPRMSWNNRLLVWNEVIKPRRDEYAEFRDLPDRPPAMPGIARIEYPPGGAAHGG